MAEIIPAFVWAEVLQRFAEQRPERVDRATSRGANDGFQLRKAQFDGVEVGAVRRQIHQRGAGGFDGVAHAGHFVRAQVVGDDDVTGVERGHEDLFHVGEEARPIDRAVEDAGRGQARDAERRDKRAGLPARKRRGVIDPDPARRAPVAPQQIRGDARFIEEDQVRGIPSRRAVAPLRPRCRNVQPVVLAGPYGFF